MSDNFISAGQRDFFCAMARLERSLTGWLMVDFGVGKVARLELGCLLR